MTRKVINSFNLIKTKDNYQQHIGTNKTKQKMEKKNLSLINRN